MYEKIIDTAKAHGCAVTLDANMSKYTSFKVGGPADVLVEPNSVDSLSEILKSCKAEGVMPIVLGNGTNVIVKDEGIRGVVILMGSSFSKIEYCGNNMFRAQAGASLSSFCF